VIAHRLSTIQHCDEICVVMDGAIVERGTHADLHAANGAYRRLCDMQAFA
jgi:ABC-type multidrug transport system fused ATPase/permease subunit